MKPAMMERARTKIPVLFYNETLPVLFQISINSAIAFPGLHLRDGEGLFSPYHLPRGGVSPDHNNIVITGM